VTAPFGGRYGAIVGGLSDEKNELNDALMQMGCQEPNNPIKVGYWLRASKDKIGSGYKLVHDGHNKFGVRWKTAEDQRRSDEWLSSKSLGRRSALRSWKR